MFVSLGVLRHIIKHDRLTQQNSNYYIMFKNLFKRKTKLERLQEKHKMLLDKSYKASTVDRTLSDQLMVEANYIEQQILDELNK